MEDEKNVNMQAYTMPAASYAIQIANSTLAFNNLAFVNILGFPAGLDMSLDISESVVASNNVTLSALVGSLADTFLTINIDDASDVSENMLALSGVAGVAGDGEGVATILGSTVSGNSIEAGLTLAFGGNASWTAEGIEDGSGNTIHGPIFAITEQPMVQTVLDLLTSLSSSSTSTNSTATLDIASLSDLLLPMLKSGACSTWTHLVNKASSSSHNTTTPPPPMNGNDTDISDDKGITTIEDIEKEKQDTLDDLLGGLFAGIFGDMGGYRDDDDEKSGVLGRKVVNDTMTELLGCPATVTDFLNTTTDLFGNGSDADISALLSGLLGNGTGTIDLSKNITALLEGWLGNGTSLMGEQGDDLFGSLFGGLFNGLGDDNLGDGGLFSGLFGGLFNGLFDDLDDDNTGDDDGGLFGGLGGLFGGLGDDDDDYNDDAGGLGKIFDDLFGGGGGLGDDDKGVEGGGGSNWLSDLLGELGVAPASSVPAKEGMVDDGTKV
jgi:hypothetical protein